MGKGILFIVAATIVAASVYGFSSMQTSFATAERHSLHEREVIARNAALAGYSIGKQALAENFAANTASGDFGDGTYAAVTAITGDEARISAKGMYGGAEIEIVADFRREWVEVFDVVPQFMQYALLSDGPLSLRGDILGDIYVLGTDVSRLNANMHTNDGLSVQGNSVRVHGFGTFVTSASFSSAKAEATSFQANYNPSMSDAVMRTSAVFVPELNTAEYALQKTPDETTSGDVTLAGSYDFGGTREDPYVWHVTGSLTFSSATAISGYALFLVDEDVLAYGNVTAGPSGYDGADESSLALYARNKIELGGSSTVYAQMFAGGDVVFLNGTPSVYGTVTTKGAADLRGTPKIYYRNASPALTYMWQAARTSIRLVAYKEL